MSLDFSGLGDLARKTPEQVKIGWQPPTIDDFGYGTVLAFDQSLTATGCIVVEHTYPRGIIVQSAAKWSTKYDGKDVLTSLKRGVEVFEQARSILRVAKDIGVNAIVHESPPNPAAVKGGGYSSLLAAQALHCAAWDRGMPIEMLGAQPAKKLVCGKGTADKTTAHAALKIHVLPWIVNSQQVTNEATRDALMVALLWLARRK